MILKKTAVGIIVGRFQTPELTESMIKLMNSVYETHINTACFLKTHPVPGHRSNPLSFVSRRQMIQTAFPNMFVAPIMDMSVSKRWVDTLISEVRKYYPLYKVHLYFTDGRDLAFYKEVRPWPADQLDIDGLITYDFLSAVNVTSRSSDDFRRGVMYGIANQYTKTLSTVDIGIIRTMGGKDHVLWGRKPNETLRRLIGGFEEPNETMGTTAEEDAAREVLEETNLVVKPEQLFYIARMNVNDWRYIGSGDQIRTTLFITFDATGDPVAGDDLIEVGWAPLSDAPQQVGLMEPHWRLWRKIQEARETVFSTRRKA